MSLEILVETQKRNEGNDWYSAQGRRMSKFIFQQGEGVATDTTRHKQETAPEKETGYIGASGPGGGRGMRLSAEYFGPRQSKKKKGMKTCSRA